MTDVAGVHHLTETGVIRGEDASRLFVFIHGYSRSATRRDRIVALAREAWGGDVDILAPEYRGGAISNLEPVQLAREISVLIAEAAEEREAEVDGGYTDITLCGFSAGALLIRKAVVYGFGSLEDHPFAEDGALTARAWEMHVIPKLDRLVLLAGMNRGWSYRSRPRHMAWWKFLLVKLGILAGRLRMFGRFVMALERGRPFVANLRVQWIRLHQRAAGLPEVIQLLGEYDDVVDREDNKDLLGSPDFVFIPVVGTGHANILNFDDDADGRHRHELVGAALANPIDELRSEYSVATSQLRSAELGVREVPANLVFLMHGIRANADWPNRLAARIEALDPTARCIRASYGYFPMLRFLLFGSRRRNVRWFMDEYTEALARFEQPVPTHFVGHSNGTHLLAEALHRYKAVSFDRVALMGSVVPSHFRWDEVAEAGRVQQVRNDRSSSDFIVGVFPGFLQRLGALFPVQWFRDVGDGGFLGFKNPAPSHAENFYFRGGHSAAYKSDTNLDSLAAFIVDGNTDDPQDLVDDASKFAVFASRLNWAVWAALLAVLVGGGWLFAVAGSATWLAGYVVVLLLLLLTV